MQLVEVKNDIAKIVYNPADNHLLPSDFLLIEDVNQKLIAQIINISTTENSNNNIADVRLALSIDKDDNLSYYNGYIPIKSSDIVYINPDEITELLKGYEDDIYFGNLANHPECFIKPSISFIKDKVYIQSDRDDKTKIIIQNMILELYLKQKKVLLLDFDGSYSSIPNIPKLKISENFRLPLNIDAFNNILEFDITDCPTEDKAVIQSIVLELREYIKTVENKFLPFTLFKNVVDNEFMSNPIQGLMLLRNKLWLYAQESIFAESKSQFELINDILEKQNLLIIDASNIEEKWYKFTIQTILNLVKKDCFFAFSLNDVNMDRKSVISLYHKPNIVPVISSSYDSKYRQILKSVCKNQILLKPSAVLNDEESYNVLLNKINSDEVLLYGESTLYLPLILELKSFDSSTSEKVLQNDIKKDVNKFFSSSKNEISFIPAENKDTEIIKEDKQVEIKEDTIEEQKEELKDEYSEEIIKPMSVVDSPKKEEFAESIFDDDFTDSDFEFLDEQNQEQITIDDIRNTNLNTEELKNEVYGVFDPVNQKEEQITDIVSETDSLIDENLVTPNNIEDKIIEDEETQTASASSDILLENEDILVEPDVIIPAEKEENNTENDVISDDIHSNEDNLEDEKPVISASSNILENEEEKDDSKIQTEDEKVEVKEEIDINELPKEKENKNQEELEIELTEETIDNIVSDSVENDKNDNNEDENISKEEMVSIDEVINDITSKMDENDTVSDNEEEKKENNKENDKADDSFVVELEDTEETNEEQYEEAEPAVPPSLNININTKNTPEVTVYETDNTSDIYSDGVPFKIGDKVYHPKHGNGVVEGFANYSNKILFCKIEFENVGIRILDPRISNIQKIS